MSFRFREFRVYNDAKIWIRQVFKLTSQIRTLRQFELATQINEIVANSESLAKQLGSFKKVLSGKP